MEIASLLTHDRVIGDGQVSSKKRALEEISALLASGTESLTAREIFDGLIGRERLGSTGLGHGVALPHARLGDGAAPVAAFIRLQSGIDFDAIDDQPVTLVFGLLVPQESTDEHLKVLARLAQMFRDDAFCQKLQNATDSAQIIELLSQDPTGDPAA